MEACMFIPKQDGWWGWNVEPQCPTSGRLVLDLPWNQISPVEALVYGIESELIIYPLRSERLNLIHVQQREGTVTLLVLFGGGSVLQREVRPGTSKIIVDFDNPRDGDVTAVAVEWMTH